VAVTSGTDGTLCVFGLATPEPGAGGHEGAPQAPPRPLFMVGSRGPGPLQFDGPCLLCFTPGGRLLVAEWTNDRVQEVALHIASGAADHVGYWCVARHGCTVLCAWYGAGAREQGRGWGR
jgi:hypothetical protein